MVVVHLHNNNDDNNERRSFAAVRGIENGNRARNGILTSATPANARANETLRNGGRVSGARTVVSFGATPPQRPNQRRTYARLTTFGVARASAVTRGTKTTRVRVVGRRANTFVGFSRTRFRFHAARRRLNTRVDTRRAPTIPGASAPSSCRRTADCGDAGGDGMNDFDDDDGGGDAVLCCGRTTLRTTLLITALVYAAFCVRNVQP